MSDERPQTPHDCVGDAAAYVLGALAPEEVEAFERHLESCVVCRDELSAFERVVDVLPAAAPQYRAPRSLRRRVLRAAREQPPPSRTDARPARWPTLVARPWLAGVGALAAAAAVVAVAAIVLGSPGTSSRVVAASVAGPGWPWNLSGGQAELILHNFPAPPAGEVYEVWLQREERIPESMARSNARPIGHGSHL